MKVVFDTNVYISAFGVSGSKSQEVFLLASREKINLFTSPAILAETANVLRKKFEVPDENIEAVIKEIGHLSKVIKPHLSIRLLEDEPDNRILECAAEAKADFIVTGDKHLRCLKKYQGAKIVSVSEFLKQPIVY